MSVREMLRARRWRITPTVMIVSSLMVVGALAVGWPFWSARQQWDQLDSAAAEFEVPPGFTEVARPRQGSAFCWVTCTGGGEAVVTLVLESDYSDPADACRALRQVVVDLTGDAVEASYLDYCGWKGELDGSATVFAGAGTNTSFRPQDGHRWTETVAIPNSRVIAFVEFNSGLE